VVTLSDMLVDGHRPFDQLLRAYRALWRLTGNPDRVLAPHYRAGHRGGPAAAPILPTLRDVADRDEHIVTFWPGQTPGTIDEQIRAAIRETATAISARSQ
jgi:hypothetical protein